MSALYVLWKGQRYHETLLSLSFMTFTSIMFVKIIHDSGADAKALTKGLTGKGSPASDPQDQR